jgi:cytochrome oxidase Cu insertion factor (SCO1/SenC/PrrC family)
MQQSSPSGRVAAALVLAAVVGVVSSSRASERPVPAAPPAVGDAASDFTLNRLDGTPVTLAALRKSGPVVVLVLRGWVGYQ